MSIAGAVVAFAPAVVLGLTFLLAPLPQDQKLYLAVGCFALVTIARDILIPQQDVLAAEFFDIPWLFYVMIIAVPALAFWLQDGRIIKSGPTVYFVLVAILSALSASTDRPRLQRFVRRDSLRNIGRDGWRILTLYAAGSCILMALINEMVWRSSSTGFWVGFQIFGWLVVQMLLMSLSLRIIVRYSANATPDPRSPGPAR